MSLTKTTHSFLKSGIFILVISRQRWNDGSIRLYFKKLKTDAGFSVDGFALAVCNEIRQALKGLIE